MRNHLAIPEENFLRELIRKNWYEKFTFSKMKHCFTIDTFI